MKKEECENCHHFNSIIVWEQGYFYQCLMGNWFDAECTEYDPIRDEGDTK